jgi:competence protein ComEC
MLLQDNRYFPLFFLCLISGICVALYPYVVWILPLLLIPTCIYLICLFTQKSTNKPHTKNTILCSIIFLILCLFLFSYGFISIKRPTLDCLKSFDNTSIEGTIDGYPNYYSSMSIFYLKTKHGRIRVKYYSNEQEDFLQNGSEVSCYGKVEDLDKYLHGNLSREIYLKKKDIQGSLIVKKDGVTFIGRSKNPIVSSINKFREKIQKNLEIATAGKNELFNIVNAIILNNKSKINMDSYAELGVAHLLSISGMHFSIISLLLLLMLFWIPLKPSIKFIVYIANLLFYLAIIGFPLPAMRSFIMVFFMTLALLVKRKTSSFYTLFAAGFIILLIHPVSALTVSFWMTFVGTCTLCVPGTMKKKIILLFLVIGLISAVSFNMVSIIGVVCNAIFSIFLVFFFGFGIIGAIFPTLTHHIFLPAISILFDGMSFIAKSLRELPFSYRYISVKMQTFGMVCATILLLLMILAYYKHFKKKWIHSIFVVAFLSFCLLFIPINSSIARITYFNVGEGDSALIQSPKFTMLIDAGDTDVNYNPAKYTIQPYLKKHGINKLDYILITHYHKDHYGGLPYIITHTPSVGVTLIPDTKSEEETFFRDFMKSCDSMKYSQKKISKIVNINISDSEKIEIRPLFPYFSRYEELNENNKSLVLRYTFGEKRFLFVGDLEIEGEMKAIENFLRVLNADVLKVGHHGSATSSSSDFLDRVNPSIGIISCGNYSYYHHPSAKVTKRLADSNIQYFTTIDCGTITIETDGKTYWFVD